MSLKNRDAIVVGEVIVVQNLRVRGVDGSRRFVARLAFVTRRASVNTRSRAMDRATLALMPAARKGAGAPTARSSSREDFRAARCGALFNLSDRKAPDGRKVDLDIRGVGRMLEVERWRSAGPKRSCVLRAPAEAKKEK